MYAESFGLKTTPPHEDWALSNAYWYAVLSTGETVFMDDNNPTKQQKSTWLALKAYLNSIVGRIKLVVFKFRSNEVHFIVKDDVSFVYFSNAVGKEWTADTEDKFFVFGWQSTPTVLENHWYKIPELIEHKVVAKELTDPSIKPEFLHKMPISG